MAIYEGRTQKRLAFLQNAFDISYELPLDSLWTGSFSLPYSDPKTKHCDSFNLVDIWDVDAGGNDKYIGLFRIMPYDEDQLSIDGKITYNLEHVFSTLLDDLMIGWHEVGNAGQNTAYVLNYLLSQQTTKRWKLGTVAYNYNFLYGWQDENILSSIFSVVRPFTDLDYYWDFDTTVLPWTLHLKQSKKEPMTDVRYRKNIAGVTRKINPDGLTTRLYCYGSGEGDNRLGISKVTKDNVPYIEENVDKYGIISQIWTDQRYTNEQSLLDGGKALLSTISSPAITYDINVSLIRNMANLRVGDSVRVVHDNHDENMVVRCISKSNVSGAPYEGSIVLGKGTMDAGSSMADMANKQRISDSYSQGSESIFTDSFQDNADQKFPAEMFFTIPRSTVHVNEILFDCKLTNFRAYSKSIAGGGGLHQSTASGGGVKKTTSSGGASLTTTSEKPTELETSRSGGSSETTTMLRKINLESTENNQSTTTTSDTRETTQYTTELTQPEVATSYDGGADYTSADSGGGVVKSTETDGYVYDNATVPEKREPIFSPGTNNVTGWKKIRSAYRDNKTVWQKYTPVSITGNYINELDIENSSDIMNTMIWYYDKDGRQQTIYNKERLKSRASGVTPPAKINEDKAAPIENFIIGSSQNYINRGYDTYFPTAKPITKIPPFVLETPSPMLRSSTLYTTSASASGSPNQNDIDAFMQSIIDRITYLENQPLPFHSHALACHSHNYQHSHTVSIPAHTHRVSVRGHHHQVPQSKHSHKFTIPSHNHRVPISAHKHSITMPEHNHSIKIPAHTHAFNVPAHKHSVDIKAHNHEMEIADHKHDIDVPQHTHNIEYGIYTGPKASTFEVYLDGGFIGKFDRSVTELNLIEHMDKNANGEILRGSHTIKVVPDGLTRVECSFQTRLFTNSQHTGTSANQF